MGKYLKDPEPRRRSGYMGDKPLLSEQAGGMPSSRPSPLRKPGLNPKQEIVDEVLRSISRRINHFGTGGGGVNALAADKVRIEDAGNFYTSDNVEGALAEIFPAFANTANVALGDALVGVKITAAGSAAMTQHARNELVWFLEDFGAVGDGVTNDAAAWALAMTGIGSANATLNGSPGKTYLIGAAGISIANKTSVRIVGNGAKIKINAIATQAPVGLGSTSIFIDTCTQTTFTGWDIDGNAIASNIIGLKTNTDCEISFNRINSGGLNGQIFTNGNNRLRILFNALTTTTGSSRGMWLGNYNTGQMEEDVMVIGNTITGTPGTAIVLASLGGRCEGNHAADLSGGSGIIFGGANGFSSKHLSIVGNVIHSVGGNGHGIQSDVIRTTDADIPVDIIISGNVCELNTGTGIYAVYLNGGTISGNSCVNNNDGASGTAYGILGEEIQNVAIIGNYCCDTRSGASRTQNAGIALIADAGINNIKNISIAGNVCNNNFEIGIQVQNVVAETISRVSITGNQCNDNGLGGIEIVEASAGTLTRIAAVGNVCAGNTTRDLRIDALDCIILDNLYTNQVNVQYLSFTDLDTTPSVLGGRRVFRALNTGATSITTLDNGVDGQELTIYASTGNTTLVNGTFILKGGVNTTMPQNGFITLFFTSALWFEVSRSY